MKKNNKDKLLKGLQYKVDDNGNGILEVDEEKFSRIDLPMKVNTLPLVFSSLNEFLGYPLDQMPWDRWEVYAWIDGEEKVETQLDIVQFIVKYKGYYIKNCQSIADKENTYIFTLTKDPVVWKEEDKFFYCLQDKESNLVYITPNWEIKVKKHRKKKEVK